MNAAFRAVLFPKLIVGKFVKRYKRFFVDVLLENNKVITAHCANSGSMKSLLETNCKVFVWETENPARKLKYSLELMQLNDGLVCVNTIRANELLSYYFLAQSSGEKNTQRPKFEFDGAELFEQDFGDLAFFEAEKTYAKGTRFDFCLVSHAAKKTWVEIKSVSLRLDNETIAFPDAITERGQKHLQVLQECVASGDSGFQIYVIQRASGLNAKSIATQFRIAKEIDKDYASLVEQSKTKNLRFRVAVADISVAGLSLRGYYSF